MTNLKEVLHILEILERALSSRRLKKSAKINLKKIIVSCLSKSSPGYVTYLVQISQTERLNLQDMMMFTTNT